MSDYAPFDQDKHLGDPPWSDEEALQAWEEAHGHDARVKCLPEYGCLTYYTEWERLTDEVDQLETEVERLRAAVNTYVGVIEERDHYREVLDEIASALDGDDHG